MHWILSLSISILVSLYPSPLFIPLSHALFIFFTRYLSSHRENLFPLFPFNSFSFLSWQFSLTVSSSLRISFLFSLLPSSPVSILTAYDLYAQASESSLTYSFFPLSLPLFPSLTFCTSLSHSLIFSPFFTLSLISPSFSLQTLFCFTFLPVGHVRGFLQTHSPTKPNVFDTNAIKMPPNVLFGKEGKVAVCTLYW